MASRYLVGIDLGTTHTVVAYAATPKAGTAHSAIRLFDIAQLTGPGAVAARPLLPSVRYHGAPGELAKQDLALPWSTPQTDDASPVVIGQWARQLGAQVPGRLVASAKSWLSHAQVDRLAPILPWGGAADVPKVSPVEASAGTLAHVRTAWNAQFPQALLEQQDIVLTLPASFDDSARALTLQAAHAAGLPTLRLLEEPQAAFYDWLGHHRKNLAQALQGSRLVLVCDVGGGTTDLSLIRVDHLPDGDVRLERIGVGKHLMLGGDNMDLALAHTVEARLERGAGAGSAQQQVRLGGGVAAGFAQVKEEPAQRAGDTEQNLQPPRRPGSTSTDALASPAPIATQPLSASQMAQLMQRCRSAKELLLAPDAPAQTTITLLGTGARLVGASRSVTLTRDEVNTLVRDGFFPTVGSDATVQTSRGALVAFGLPYARDPAITRHLAEFLRQHASAIRQAVGEAPAGSPADVPPLPDTLLLNGGVFHAPALAQRLQETLSAWRGAPLRLLHNDNPDLAVARGAVAYALAQRGQGLAIGAGCAHSYFLLLQGARGVATGTQRGPHGICILPRLSEPGQELRLTEHTFALRVGQPVQFHLFCASADVATPYTAGQTVALTGSTFVRLPPIVTTLPANDGVSGKAEVPVQLVARLTELGTLALHCVSVADPSQRWLLEFDLRQSTPAEASGDTSGADGTGATADAASARRVAQAVTRLDRVFGSNAQKVDAKEVRQLRTQLEQLLGSREQWPLDVLRPLFDALWHRARGRRRSAEHERVWLNLAGYCLRPGFGDALDPWRVQQLWGVHANGVQFARDKAVCAQWWTLWRRVAGGLASTAQLRLLDDFACNLQSQHEGASQGAIDADVHPVRGSEDDMLRLGAALERIPASYKAEVGSWLLSRIEKSITKAKRHDAAHGNGAKNDTSKGNNTGAVDAAVLNTQLWVLGRIGARQPLHGSSHEVVEPQTAQAWIEALLALDWRRLEAAAFATAQMARMTDDRVRDLPLALREQVAQRLQAAHTPPGWAEMVRQTVPMDAATTSRIVGESLPPGLRLMG